MAACLVAGFNGSVGRCSDGAVVEARIRALGARLIPPEPLGRDHKPLCVEIPAPRRLEPTSTPQQRVQALAGAYRTALLRRYQITSRYMRTPGLALEGHKDYAKLVKFADGLIAAAVAPVAWVLFSFDAWVGTPLGAERRSPPPAKWVWSIKRLREQGDRVDADRYAEPALRTTPEAAELWADWRCMWLELLRVAPVTRDQIALIVDRWFPGETYESRLARARAQTWQWQASVDQEIAAGEWPIA